PKLPGTAEKARRLLLRRLPAAIALIPGPLAPLLGLVPLLLTLGRHRLSLVPLLPGVLALLRILTLLRGLPLVGAVAGILPGVLTLLLEISGVLARVLLLRRIVGRRLLGIRFAAGQHDDEEQHEQEEDAQHDQHPQWEAAGVGVASIPVRPLVPGRCLVIGSDASLFVFTAIIGGGSLRFFLVGRRIVTGVAASSCA